MRQPLAVLLLTLAPAVAAAQPSTLVHPERYSPALATAYPAPNTWIAYPFPSSIGLYKEGEGYPRFDAAQAKTYFTRVTDKVAGLVQDTIRKWDDAGL